MSGADSRRDLLKKAAILGSGGVAGAALMGGLDRTVFAGPSSSIAASNQGDAVGTASVIVWADLSGDYYVKDAGIGSSPGSLIVNANVITAYGHSLGAGTSGASTTSAGIQEAINSVGAAGGGTVHIKAHPGGYQLGTGVTDGGYDGIVLRGDGFASMIRCPAGADFDLIHINKSDWVIQGLSLNGTGQTAGHDCINLGTASKNCQVLDNFITGGGYYDILAQGTGHIVERNMTSASGHDCVVLSAATDCIVANNVCDTPGHDNCIALVTCTNILVSRNVCINAVASGVGLENQGAGPCSRCSVIGNILISSQNYGVGYSGVIMPYANKCVVKDNSIESPMSHAINIAQADGAIVEGNYISNSGGSGINCSTNSTEIQINGNFVDTPANYGIIVSGTGTSHVQINGNAVLNNAASNGIHLGSVTYFVVSGNRYHQASASKTGVGIETSGSTKGTLVGNIVLANGDSGEGILISAGTDIIIEGNYVEGFAVGIDEIQASDYNIIRNNDVRNNNATKLAVAGAHTVVVGNLGYNPVPPFVPALPGSGVPFPTLPYDAIYVITIVNGISGLTLDGVPVLFSVAGASVFVAAGHVLTPTYAGSPVFEVLPI